ncbi:Transcription initiation factor TFIID subunit 9B [Quaeritorhiza haematococci]|nr:Transcription initiation factor TFIID subunit 9B [Quaeritorhiza haematococci]
MTLTNAQAAALQQSFLPEGLDPLHMPRDAKLLSLLLQSMDIDDYEPKVIPQLLEFTHRYVVDVLTDAQLFAEHAGRSELDLADVRLAVEGRISHSFTNPPAKDFLFELAEKKNSQPLPIVPEKFGVRLPPERHCLTGINFQILPERTSPRKSTDKSHSKAPATTATPASMPTGMPSTSTPAPFPSSIPSFPPMPPSTAPMQPPPMMFSTGPPPVISQSASAANADDEDYDMDG